LPLRWEAPPVQAASGGPASLSSPRENSQYSAAPHSLESWHAAPGLTHYWKEQTCPAMQQASPQASAAEQQLSPAHTPPSPHAWPVMQGLD
jgi:hypothetical protein